MDKNVGNTDAFIRFMLGLTFLINLIILEPGVIGGIVLWTLSLIFFFTAFLRSCPILSAFGFCTADGDCECDSCKAKSEDGAQEA
ncbi:MAG: DUF2892 domain-containing protein [bacterium]|nr:DUF2892 domain-containing protein [bacterium]